MKNWIKFRNAEIVQKRNSGASYSEIASEFKLSRSRIQQIVNRYRRDVKRQERSSKLLNDLRTDDNIDEKWPTETLIQGLRFPLRAEKRITEYFCGSDIDKISLRDIMDFLITDFERTPHDLYEACPAYKQKHIGCKTYAAAIKHLSEQDLGNTFYREWNKRLKKLVCFMQRRGGYSLDFIRLFGI